MSLELAAQHLASRGRKGDSMLVHMAPEEVSGLQALAMAAGGTLTLNPDTGLPEANFLKRMLPALIGAGLMFATGGTAAPLIAGMSNAATIGLGLGGFETLRTGSLEKGLMAGLGAYGGAGLTGGLMGAGAAGAAGATGTAPAMSMAPATASPATTALTNSGITGLAPAAAPAVSTAATASTVPGMMKYGLTALAPAMEPDAAKPYDGGGPNPYNFAFNFERPEGPSYDSREALQLRGRLRPITSMAEGGPIEDMSYQNRMDTMMANGGQMFAGGGKTEDPAKGMTGASADAFRYLMGQSNASPATVSAQQFAARSPAAAAPMVAAPAANRAGGFGGFRNLANMVQDATQAGRANTFVGQLLGGGRNTSQTPSFSFDPTTGQFTTLQMPEPEAALTQATTNPEAYYAKAGGLMSMAQGGVSHLGDYSDGGRLLKGPGDGVSDSIPATIANKRPARLADGEFVVPARIVSELGNGSTDAGARKLYAMMDRIQKARGKTTGKDRVAVNSRAEKLLPA